MAGRWGCGGGLDVRGAGARSLGPGPDRCYDALGGATTAVGGGGGGGGGRPAGDGGGAGTAASPGAVLPGGGPGGVPVPGALIRTRTRPFRRQKPASAASGRRAVSTAGRPARMASSRTGVPSPADTSGLGIRPPARSAGGMPDGEEAPRGWLQGAGLESRGGRGAHGLADAVAADRGGQGDPADCGGAVLSAGHRPADPDGLFHQGCGVRAAFAVVGVEQAFPGPAGEHVRKLPGQVVGVAQPARQALADERRGEVGGVTEQEDPPATEAGCHLGAEGVGRAAKDLQAVQVAAPGPGLQQLPEGGRGDQAGLCPRRRAAGTPSGTSRR